MLAATMPLPPRESLTVTRVDPTAAEPVGAAAGLSRVLALRDLDRVPAIGDRVADTYRIGGVLGSGGMGTVYLAYEEALDRNVALKLVHDDLVGDADVRLRFLEEARAMAQVRHPNVVTIFGFGVHAGRPYIVMEHVAGENLATWLSHRGKPSLHDAMSIIDALCRGVHAIHLAGALHRDIKPSNVLIDEDGRVELTDFGLSTPSTRVDQHLELGNGTPAYMAPEIARDEPISPLLARRVDVYALALVAFELLTGRRPFDGATVEEMLDDHAHRPPPRPSELAPDLPSVFDEPLLRALAKAPERRTPSAEALRIAMQQAYATALEFPRGLSILCVDDEPSALIAMRELLRMDFPGAEIIIVASTPTALEIAARDRPDVVVTDFDMPCGGAPLLTDALRGDPRTAEIPIIVVTGRAGADDWHDLRSRGADRFLMKPIDADALSATIRSLVAARKGV